MSITPTPAGGTLLAALDELPGGARLRGIGRAARDLAATDPAALTALLDELVAGDADRRRLAVTAAHAVGDVGRLRAALADPAPAVAAAALSAGIAVLPDDALLAVLLDGPATLRRQTHRLLRRADRPRLADAALPAVRERWGDEAAARLLPACSAPTVRALLPGLDHALGTGTALARSHPDPVLDWIRAGLAAATAPEDRERRWARCAAMLAALAPLRPVGVLDLVAEYAPDVLPPVVTARLTVLAAADAPRLVRLLAGRLPDAVREWGLRPSVAARHRLAAVPDADLAALARAALPDETVLTELLRAVPPHRRPALLDAAYEGVDRSTVAPTPALLELLPAARRHAEAARTMGLREVRDDPTYADITAAYLDFDQAADRLRALTRRRDADERATGYRLLLSAAARRRDPALFAEVLAGLDRLRHEQDPVRSAVLTVLAATSPARFDAAAEPALETIAADALAARDRSATGTAALARLAVGLFGRDGLRDWSLRTIEALYRAGGGLGLRLDRLLPAGAEVALLARLGPVLAAGVERGRHQPVLALAAALGRRAHDLPELQALLGRIATGAPSEPARTAIGEWLAPRRGRADRLGRLAAADPSTLALPEVFALAARLRPDLADRVLAAQPLPGRFTTGRAVPVPTAGGGYRLWSPARRAAYAALLGFGVADDGQSMDARTGWLRELVAVAGAEAARPYLTDPTPPELTTAALAGLSGTDRPDRALPPLLAALDSDHAGVAAPVLARCARDLRPALLADVLAGVLRDARRVTVRKETLRLVAAERVPGAVGLLAAVWDDADEHRDVRGAAARALVDRLDDEAAWRVLAEVAAAERDLVLPLLTVAAERLPADHRARFGRLLAGTAHHPDPDVRSRSLVVLGRWARYAPELADLLCAVVLDLGDTQWRRAAAGLALCWWSPPRRLAGLVVGLLAERGAGPDAGRERDQSARQRIAVLVAAGVPSHRRIIRHRDAALAAADTLWDATEHLPEAVALTLRALPVETAHDCAAALVRLADRLSDRPVAAADAAGQLAGACTALARTLPVADPMPAVAALAGRADTAGGLLAAALLAWHGGREHWPAPARDALRALRAHPSEAVRAAALRVWTAEE